MAGSGAGNSTEEQEKMACEKCEQAGKAPKIIHFERCGRWETRVFCEHTYKRAGLTEHNKIWHAQAHQPRRSEQKRRRAAVQMQHARWVHGGNGCFHSGQLQPDHKWAGRHVNELIREEFVEKFGMPATLNALMGRHRRLVRLQQEKVGLCGGCPVCPFSGSCKGADHHARIEGRSD